MVLVERRRHLLGQDARRHVLGAHAALLDDDLPLRLHLFRLEAEVHHAVGLHLHHGLEMGLGDALEVGCVVGAGEGVLLAAEPRHDGRELAVGELLGGLEHQVLEEVRDARYAGRLVGGPGADIDHVGDDRRAVVGNDDHGHPVGKLELAHGLGGGSVRGRDDLRDQHEGESKEAEALAWCPHGAATPEREAAATPGEGRSRIGREGGRCAVGMDVPFLLAVRGLKSNDNPLMSQARHVLASWVVDGHVREAGPLVNPRVTSRLPHFADARSRARKRCRHRGGGAPARFGTPPG